jgi:hypothetical protein
MHTHKRITRAKIFARPAFRILVLLAPLGVGCNLLTPIIFIGEHKKQIAPEFDKLAKKKVAVLVWVHASTLFDYPHARFELISYLSDKLSAETERRGMGTSVTDPRSVEDFLQRNPDARIDPRTVGRQFEADYVLYVEVLEFHMREPDQPQFLRGTIQASIAVHDMQADADLLQRYDLSPVRCLYPEQGPVMLSAGNASLIREGAYRKFAELIARKFYAYTVDL